jgi:uncharacterized protein (DUF983 family)
MPSTTNNTSIHFGIQPDRSVWESLKRGWSGKCPECGKGHIFRAFLKVRDNCEVCGLELAHHRADDAPPYFTILIVGHLIVPLMVVYERTLFPPLWHHLLIGVFGTLAMSLWLLPRIKGALVAFQWAKLMHGFGDEPRVAISDA